MIVRLANSMKLHLTLHVEGGGVVRRLGGGERNLGPVRPAVAEREGRELVRASVLEGHRDRFLALEVVLPELGVY